MRPNSTTIEAKVAMKKFSYILILMVLFAVKLSAKEHEETHNEQAQEEEFNAAEFILHHVKDVHDWHIYGEGENAIHLHLPIILLDNGLQVFSSGAFSVKHNAHGHEYTTTEDGSYVLYHEKIYKAEGGVVHFDEAGHVQNERPLDFSITRNVASMMLSVVILLLVFMKVGSSYKKRGVDSAPKGLQSFMEPLVLFVRDEIARPNIGEKKYAKYMPYLLTAFFFIWINNLLGLIPFFPGGSNLTGNIAFTLVMAILTFLVTTFSGNKAYWSHILAPPVPKALYPIMIPVELIGIFTKPFALMVRLFANITAGHIVVLAFICIIFINKNIGWAGLSVPMALFIGVLELLVAFLQAFIFTMLSALFIGSAVEEHEHH